MLTGKTIGNHRRVFLILSCWWFACPCIILEYLKPSVGWAWSKYILRAAQISELHKRLYRFLQKLGTLKAYHHCLIKMAMFLHEKCEPYPYPIPKNYSTYSSYYNHNVIHHDYHNPLWSIIIHYNPPVLIHSPFLGSRQPVSLRMTPMWPSCPRLRWMPSWAQGAGSDGDITGMGLINLG